MTEQADLFVGARRVFWGCFFLLLDFNLNFNSTVTIPLLANVIGWVFLWLGVDELARARPSLGLLKPFCIVLGACSLTQFAPAVDSLLPGWLNLLTAIMTLYTYFQLFTDLAAIAQENLWDEGLVKRLRTSRTLLVVCQTALFCYDLLISFTALALLLMVVSLSVYVFLLVQLWRLSQELKKQQSL